jgi:predicted ATPase
VLRAALAARNMLVVVDNCEHLRPECGWLLQQLLEACPAVHVLATSREGLGSAGETCWLVPPLSVSSVGDDRADPVPFGARRALGGEASASAWAEGQAISLEQACALARGGWQGTSSIVC